MQKRFESPSFTLCFLYSWPFSELLASIPSQPNRWHQFQSLASIRYSLIHSQPSHLRELSLVGNVAPDFEAEAVFDQEFIKVKLSEYFRKKYVVLFFYPLDFTFVCPTEITAFSDRYEEFKQINTEVLGISVDSVVKVRWVYGVVSPREKLAFLSLQGWSL